MSGSESQGAGGAGVVAVYEEAAAAHIAGYRQRHGQRKLHGHGRVVGVAALLHNVAAHLRGQRVRRYHQRVAGHYRHGGRGQLAGCGSRCRLANGDLLAQCPAGQGHQQ